jgi:hypothetical protein
MEASAFRPFEMALADHDRRLVANHDSIAKLRDTSAGHDRDIAVITTELRETREDIADMRTALDRSREEQKAEMTWVRRGLWVAAGSFLVFIIALGTLIAQIAGG